MRASAETGNDSVYLLPESRGLPGHSPSFYNASLATTKLRHRILPIGRTPPCDKSVMSEIMIFGGKAPLINDDPRV